MKKMITAGMGAVVLLVAWMPCAYPFALNISPPSFTAKIAPGESTSGTITVSNGSDDRVGILVYAQDWVYAPDGSKTFHAAGTTPLSCAEEIRIFPKKFNLEPGDKMPVQYTITLPQDASGGYYAVIFFESVPLGEEEDAEGMMIRFAGRLGTIVYAETEGTVIRKADVNSFSVTPPTSNSPLVMNFVIHNLGNVYIGAEGTLNIIDAEGNVYGKKNFGPVNTLPGDSREATVEWFGELEEGSYFAVMTLDAGGDMPVVKEAEIAVRAGGSIDEVEGDAGGVSVTLLNTGQINLRAEGTIEILNDNGSIVTEINLGRTLIAAERSRTIREPFENPLPSGTYTARVRVILGEETLTEERPFTVQ